MKIISLQKTHIQEIIPLSEDAFGKGFLSENYINKYIESDNYTGLVSIDNNKLAGYILFNILLNKEFISEMNEGKEWFEENFKEHKVISLIKQIVVSKQHQNQGIASQLMKESLKQTNNLSSITCCLAWKKGNQVAIKNTLLSSGFDFQVIINNYWSKESIEKNYSCGFCGDPPCNCGAEVYTKKNASI